MLKNTFLLLLVSFVTINIFSQEKVEFKPHGDPIIRVFANYHTDFNNIAKPEIKRGYLGYKYSVSEKYSLKVIYDVADPIDGGRLKHTGYLKIAQLQYKFNKLQWRVGMIPTKQFKYQEHWWGYRYIQKSFQDLYGFNSSADIGASFEYKIIDAIRIEGIVQNGEGYKNIQADATFRGGVGLTIEPFESFRFRLYYDNSTKPSAQLQSFAGYIGYDFKKKISLGAEYNLQLDYKLRKGYDLSGASAYITYFINKRYQVFGRYDYLESNTVDGELEPWNYKKNGHYMILGFQAKLVKGVKVSLNYRGLKSLNTNKDINSMMYICFEYKLK